MGFLTESLRKAVLLIMSGSPDVLAVSDSAFHFRLLCSARVTAGNTGGYGRCSRRNPL